VVGIKFWCSLRWAGEKHGRGRRVCLAERDVSSPRVETLVQTGVSVDRITSGVDDIHTSPFPLYCHIHHQVALKGWIWSVHVIIFIHYHLPAILSFSKIAPCNNRHHNPSMLGSIRPSLSQYPPSAEEFLANTETTPNTECSFMTKRRTMSCYIITTVR
jgi:hypothetical protein